MRRHVFQTLLAKELHRLLANRGGLVVMALLVAAAALTRFIDPSPLANMDSTHGCFVDYWREDAWVRHLRNNVPPQLHGRIHFRSIESLPQRDETLVYPAGHGAIQLRTVHESNKNKVLVWVWYPGRDATSMAEFERWFWEETVKFVQEAGPGDERPSFVPSQRSSLIGSSDFGLSIVTGLVLFAVFLINVYIMPSLQAEEREKGLLIAQMLSPVTVAEILSAKLVVYLACSLALGGVLAGLTRPVVLVTFFFWLALATAGLGSWGLGMTIASLTRTQRAASMAALSYLLAVTCLLTALRQFGISEVSQIFVEFHYPRLLHAALNDSVQQDVWYALLTATVLSLVWCGAGVFAFRSRGWR